ncbi:MAG TPA: TatD family hydrolase [Patescibacteria group bacterium]|nr:TatD family hydrolase [Patescibacteria group bacterium]
MLIDSHAHLNMDPFRDDLDRVLERARAAGVGEILNVGYDPRSIGETIALTERYGEVYAAIGIHPHEAKHWSDELEKKIKQLLLRKKVLALGEIGLDFYRDLSPRDVQRDVFRRQIGIACYFDKPIVVHCRDAFRDVIDILRSEGAMSVGGIFHAFSGGIEEALEVMELGFLFGIGGPLTYRKSRLPDVAARLPSSAFLLETDCPYLPPVPYRGKRNEPAYVRFTAEKMAEIRGVSVEDIERAAEVNYRTLLHGIRDYPTRIAYRLRNNCYLNVTGICTNNCIFCSRLRTVNFLYGYNLNLVTDPTVDEMIDAARGLIGSGGCGEIVFCGYGEPTARLKEILDVAAELGTTGLPLRLNTNGHGNMIHGRNIVPELERHFATVSVSLNAPDRYTYRELCRPDAGEGVFDSVVDFIRKAAASRMKCMVTALDYPEVDIERCGALVRSIPGATFSVRRYHLSSPVI